MGFTEFHKILTDEMEKKKPVPQGKNQERSSLRMLEGILSDKGWSAMEATPRGFIRRKNVLLVSSGLFLTTLSR